MSNNQNDLPTPGPNPPIPSWEEYNQLEEAIHDYLDHEPDDPAWDDIWRALGAIMGEYQRDAFINAFDLSDPAESSEYPQDVFTLLHTSLTEGLADVDSDFWRCLCCVQQGEWARCDFLKGEMTQHCHAILADASGDIEPLLVGLGV